MLKDASNIPRISRKFCPSSQIWDPKPPMFIIKSLTQFAAGFPSILRHTHTHLSCRSYHPLQCNFGCITGQCPEFS